MKWLCKKNLNRNFAEIVLLLFSALSLGCAFYYTLSFPVDAHAIYTLGLLFLVLAGTAWASFSATVTVDHQGSRFESYVIMAIFFFALLASMLFLDRQSVWLDEELQINAVSGQYNSIVQGAAFTQMPLSYYYTALGISLVGLSEWGSRISSCFFFALSASLFASLVFSLFSNRVIQIFGSFMYVSSPWLIRYAQEGRPYACLMFCGVLWLCICKDFFFCHERDVKRQSIFLFCSTLLLLLSIAFQSVIFLACLAPPLGILILLKAFRRKAIFCQAATALALLLVAPLIQLTRTHSSGFLHNSLDLSKLKPSWNGMELVLAQIHAFLGGYLYLYLISMVLASIVFVYRRAWKRPLETSEGMVWFGIFSCVFFVLFFWIAFSLFVNHDIYPRYYLVIFPMVILVILSSLQLGALALNDIGLPKSVGLYLQSALLSVFVIGGLPQLTKTYEINNFHRFNPDYKSLFEHFKAVGNPGDVAYVIPYQRPEIWEQIGFLSKKIYYPEGWPVHLTDQFQLTGEVSVTDLILKDVKEKNPKHVFFVIFDPANEMAEIHINAKFGGEVYAGNGFRAYKLTVTKNLSHTTERFLKNLLWFSVTKEKAFRAYDILLSLAEQEGNARKCFSYLRDLTALDGGKAKIRALIQIHGTKCQKLEQREGVTI